MNFKLPHFLFYFIYFKNNLILFDMYIYIYIYIYIIIIIIIIAKSLPTCITVKNDFKTEVP